MPISSPETLVLYKHKKEFKKLLMLIVIPIVLSFASQILLFVPFDNAWTSFWQKIQDNPMPFLLIGLLLAFVIGFSIIILVYRYQALKHERLSLNAEGISYQSYLPKFLQGFIPTFHHDWLAKWPDITAIYLKPPMPFVAKQPLLITLGFHIGLRYHEIFPCQWVDPKEETDYPIKLPRNQRWRSSPEQIKTALQACPLIKYLIDRGIEIEIDPNWTL